MTQEGPGSVIGRYKLLQQLGEGGFGVVYQAEQTEPVRRTVALKVIKLGMDTRQVIARFEAERQALALMDHPGIAKVLDAGSTEAGRPYFVMELVKGIPITEYCDRARLDTAARLHFFREVCHAVQHAHQKGIVHRDLKPSNILVALHDGKAVPKVIDFGIAKATDRHLTDKTLFTEFRQMIGTPEYMAPEQAEMSGLDVDTRADVYSLGVLLYELLTGTKPHDLRTLASKGYDEILRTIREVDPQRPSTRVYTMGEEVEAVASKRHTAGRTLGRARRGDLDRIVMKALEKDRSRRYDTAIAMALDIQRHLEHQPVAACPPSAVYRARKYVRRHRLGVAAASAVFGTLVLGVALSFAGYADAAERRGRARASREAAARDQASAEQARAGEAEQRALAEAREREDESDATRAKTVVDLVQDMLGSADPHEVKGRDYTVRQLLDDFDRGLGTRLKDQPEVEADVRTTMAKAYLGLGLHDKAEPHAKRALEIRREVFGEENEPFAAAVEDLALVLHAKGAHDEAEGLLRDALAIRRKALGDDHPYVATSLNNLASVRQAKGAHDEAEVLHREALALRRRTLGDAHPEVATSLNNLAEVLHDRGSYDEAEGLHREALAIRRKTLGEDHPHVSASLGNLAMVLHAKGAHDEAEGLLREALATRRRALGDDHPDVATGLNNLAGVLLVKGSYDEADRLFREALAIWREMLGEEHPLVEHGLRNLLQVLLAKEDFAGAEVVGRELLARGRSDGLLAVVGMSLLKQAKWAEAELIARECLAIREKEMPDHWLRWNAASMLGEALSGQGRHAEAEPLLIEGYEKMLPPDPLLFRKREALDRIVRLYEGWGKPEKAASWTARRSE